MQYLPMIIERSWGLREGITHATQGEMRDAVNTVMTQLDKGEIRVAEKKDGQWIMHEWIKKAILLYFKLNAKERIAGGPGKDSGWYDIVPSKFEGWDDERWKASNFRAVPNCIVRYSAHIAKDVVLMPSFVNVGAFVDSGTMIDTWATVGSCAQIGKNCHISGGTGIGGVLEPLQSKPVIIEDNCFIGARSEIAEGVIVEEGAVVSMGVFISASTKVVDRETGAIYTGRVPAYSVVVPGSLPHAVAGGPSTYCAVIVKKVDEQTRSKTSINELLRNVA